MTFYPDLPNPGNLLLDRIPNIQWSYQQKIINVCQQITIRFPLMVRILNNIFNYYPQRLFFATPAPPTIDCSDHLNLSSRYHRETHHRGKLGLPAERQVIQSLMSLRLCTHAGNLVSFTSEGLTAWPKHAARNSASIFEATMPVGSPGGYDNAEPGEIAEERILHPSLKPTQQSIASQKTSSVASQMQSLGKSSPTSSAGITLDSRDRWLRMRLAMKLPPCNGRLR